MLSLLVSIDNKHYHPVALDVEFFFPVALDVEFFFQYKIEHHAQSLGRYSKSLISTNVENVSRKRRVSSFMANSYAIYLCSLDVEIKMIV